MSSIHPQLDLDIMEGIETTGSEGGSTSKKGPNPKEWADWKQTIVDLFITRDLPLSEVKTQMDRLGFIATKRMYKSRLALWNVGKNASRKDYLVLARLFADRRSRGLPEGSFVVHNKIRSIEDLRRYLRQHGENEEAFFIEAEANPSTAPVHIHRVEQHHELLASADETGSVLQGAEVAAAAQSAYSFAASWPFTEPADGQHFDPISHLDPAGSFEHRNSDVTAIDHAARTRSGTNRTWSTLFYSNAEQDPITAQAGLSAENETLPDDGSDDTSSSYRQMQMESQPAAAIFAELSDLSSWQSLINVGKDPTRFDASGYAETSLPFVDQQQAGSAFVDENSMPPIGPEDPDLPRGMRQRDDLAVFMSACMLACMYEEARKNDIKALCLEQAKSAFRRLCIVRSPFVLTSAITMLTWMLVHVQGSFTDDVMWSTHCIASEILGNKDPICVLLHWMFLATATKLAESSVDSSELRRIQLVLREIHGDYHRHSIVARYCLAFHLMNVDRLSNADALAEAAAHLKHIETIAATTLGASDLMTIIIASTLSRAHSRMEDDPSALDAIKRSLQAAPLGANHPFRLESIVRLAVLYRKVGRLDETERLYWIALRGRIATLGPEHRSTNKSHHSLVAVLKERGRWESMKDEVHRLVVNPQVAVTEYESWWRRVVEANQDSGRFRASSEETDWM